ncbi:hypothetical protein AQUCO_07100006v1 [Aquilegia coerulea]|uniref:S-protein homolog n=1 Tax=Aquilegia coerulea TaxID=218851 RepID=A0A2G5CAM8_AQUCA|nr:hypothetical protein AQUCO_07100006v1 [Aquilegia coerulea]
MVATLWSCSSVSGVYDKVYIENRLGPNNTLTVHCKSKDNDLGEHNVDFNQSYDWGFNETPRTLFWCHIWWYDHHHLVWVNKDMFNLRMRFLGCINDGIGQYRCVRRAQWDGIYASQWNRSFTKTYDWIRE